MERARMQGRGRDIEGRSDRDGRLPRREGGVRRFFLEGAPAVRSRLERAGWEPTRRWDFDLYWRKQVPSRSFFRQLPPGARINHIPGIAALTSPVRLAQVLEAQRRLLGAVSTTRRAQALPPVRLATVLGPPELGPQGRDRGREIGCFVLLASVDPLLLRFFGGDGFGQLPHETQRAIRQLVVSVVAAAYDELVRAVRDDVADRTACFELLRFDLLLGDGAPHLVRCALSPAIDECLAADVLALLAIVPDAGVTTRFETLVPAADGMFVRTCPWPRWSDLQAAGMHSVSSRVSHRATSRVFDGAVVLFQEETARFHVLNDTGGFLWLRTRDGATPSEVATDTITQFGIDELTARGDVWDALARWASDGWIGFAEDDAAETQPVLVSHATELGRCLLARSGALLALPSGAAVALVGREASGVSAVAAVLAARGQARVVSDVPWVDEERAEAVPSPAKLAVYESDDAAVAALSASFAASPHHVAPSEIGVRFLSPQLWVGPPAEVVSIVVVRRAARGAPTELRPLSPRQALLALVGLGMTAEPPWTTERAMDLLAWLEDTPAFELLASDVVSAADAWLSREGE